MTKNVFQLRRDIQQFGDGVQWIGLVMTCSGCGDGVRWMWCWMW
jgi:hypothetical protein